jgi:hypothetical protein
MYEKDLASSLANVAVRNGGRGFTFDDLARAAVQYQATVGRVADWLAHARSSGFVDEVGFDAGMGHEPLGPRRYRLATVRRSKEASESAPESLV